MEYKVIPFVASIDSKKENLTHVAEQLQEIIKHHTNKGWNYVRLESVTTFVEPESGCFGGGTPGYTTSSQMIVFSKS